MCHLPNQTERSHYQARPMCFSIVIIPILQWHRKDGAVWLKITDSINQLIILTKLCTFSKNLMNLTQLYIKDCASQLKLYLIIISA